MGINIVVAVTDLAWFSQLSRETEINEVNFWSPSANNFRALQKGELFLFKLRAPYNVIGGGGIFTHASKLPCSLAWKAFGRSNGASSEQKLRELISKNQRQTASARLDSMIGCRILAQPFFFTESDYIPVPSSWSPNIVSLKVYNTGNRDGRRLWDSVKERLEQRDNLDLFSESARYGKPCLIEPRLGQGGFRTMVTDIYQRRCAVTKESTLPALEAAHIKPYRRGGLHKEQNGLLLRSDIHNLFDTGYVTVTPDMRFKVSSRIKTEFENGRDYYRLDNKEIYTPLKAERKPDPQALKWHNENCFLG